MPNILHRVGIAAEPMRVFEALTTVEGIRGWWISETTGEATEGAQFQFRKNRIDVVHADPSLVTWRYTGPASDWVGTEIKFKLEWRDGQTFVLFSHEGWQQENEFMHGCSTNWASYLISLKSGAEGHIFNPYPGGDISRWD